MPLGGPVPEDYRFDEGPADLEASGPHRPVAMSELFGSHQALLLYGFMLGDAAGDPFRMCTSLIDGFDGAAADLGARVEFAVVAAAPLERLRSYARQRGWRNVRLVSSAANAYSYDYGGITVTGDLTSRMNVFTRREETIHHFYATEKEPSAAAEDDCHLDLLWTLWGALDLTPEGRGDWRPDPTGAPLTLFSSPLGLSTPGAGLVRCGRSVCTGAMRSIWKGAISFGLVSVPIKVYSATEDHDVSLHQVHHADGGRIRYQRRCEVCGKVVEYGDIDKAYDEGDRTVILTEDDLDSLPVERDRAIEVVEFVPSDQLDPIMLDRSYFLEPDKSAVKAYSLLRRALEETDRTAIVQFSLRQKTRLGALRSRGKVLMLQSLLWDDEVREADFPSLKESVKVSENEKKMSAQLIDSMSTDFAPDKFSDDYQDQLKQLIEAKLSEGDAVDTAATFGEEPDDGDDGGGQVIDLVEALRRSVAERSGSAGATEQAPAAKTSAKKAGKKSTATNKSTMKKAVEKSPAEKSPAKKSPAKKSPAKKSPAKKTPAKKAS